MIDIDFISYEIETEIVFMEDDADLKPVTVKLPDPPPLSEFVNYGLPVKEQKWERFKPPAKLIELMREPTMDYREKVRYMEANQAYYAKEIEYIQRDVNYSRNGFWILIKGKGYYIPRFFYNYIQWWKIDSKFVEFRNRDRKFYIWDEFVDKDIDCIGTNYPKGRREGATNRIECKHLYYAAETPEALIGMQSKDEQHAATIHETMSDHHFRYHMPFWRKPIYNGNNNDISALSFTTPTAKSKPNYGAVALNTVKDYRDSGVTAYDGLKLRRLFNDEIGKTVEVDVKRRFDVQKPCMIEGSTIIGKCWNASTVDEMEKGGGKNFKKICDHSHFHKRNDKTGRTGTWLYNFFMPSSEGFGGEMPKFFQEKYGTKNWIDEYGFDVIDPETGRPAALEYHMAEREQKKKSGDIEGYIEYCRQFPLRWRDCWMAAANENNFNIQILEDRKEEFRFGNPFVQRGFFRWVDNKPDTMVEWVNDPNGKFEISYQFDDPRHANKFYTIDGVRKPGNTSWFVAGGDAFKFKKTKSGKKSKGGGAVFWKHDPILDPPWKDMHDWVSNRFICTYLHRPLDKKIYGEDMLMMCVYFGCEMFPEINVEFLWDYFTERGYGGYLLFTYDWKKDLVSATPGAQTTPKIIEDIFRETQFHIQNHGHRECHEDLIQQWIEIEDDMGDYDLMASAGYALLGARKITFNAQEKDKIELDNYFPTIYYNLEENY